MTFTIFTHFEVADGLFYFTLIPVVFKLQQTFCFHDVACFLYVLSGVLILAT